MQGPCLGQAFDQRRVGQVHDGIVEESVGFAVHRPQLVWIVCEGCGGRPLAKLLQVRLAKVTESKQFRERRSVSGGLRVNLGVSRDILSTWRGLGQQAPAFLGPTVVVAPT